MPLLAAHRGLPSKAPENSLLGMALAIDAGADGIEIDVRMSSDGVPVVVHDEDTERVAGVARLVAEQTAEQLSALDLGAGQHIPTLAQALSATGDRAVLWLDLKITADRVEAALGPVPVDHSVAVQAFDLAVARRAAEVRPDIPSYWMQSAPKDESGARGPLPLSMIDIAKDAKLGLAVDYRGLTDEFARLAASKQVPLYVWTVNDAATAQLSAARGATWIESDEVGALRSALAR